MFRALRLLQEAIQSIKPLSRAGAGAPVSDTVGGKATQGLHWAWRESKVQYGLYTFDHKVVVPHVFSKAKGGKTPRDGHVYDTPENRRIMTETFMDENNFVGKNKYGSEFYARLLPDGTESWVRVDNGIIKSAGINHSPRYYSSDGTLKFNTDIIKRGFKP